MSPQSLIPSFASRFAPKSTYMRFMLALVLACILSAAAALMVSHMVARNMVHGLYEDACGDSLRSAVDMVGRSNKELEEYHNHLLSAYRLTLTSSLDNASMFMAKLEKDAHSDDLRDSSRFLLDYILTTKSMSGIWLMAVGGTGLVMAHPDQELLETRLEDLAHFGPAAEGMARELRAELSGVTVFSSCLIPGPGGIESLWIMAGRRFHTWGLTLFAMVPAESMDQQLALRRESILDELRAHMREIIIARSGFVFLFTEDCEIISHPLRTSQTPSNTWGQVTDMALCQELKASALRPWGDNRLAYTWNRPDHQQHFGYEKIAWVTVEPTTGWYVAACAYVQDMEAELPTFVGRIFLPALILILLIIGMLALFLRRLLTPIKTLSTACTRAAAGDFSIQAEETDSGDVGFLIKQFNTMIRSIGELRQADETHRRELNTLNTNLERMVSIRTRALERKARKLEEANIRLRELDKIKSEFLSSVSHELRTPLTSILGFTKLIRSTFKRRILKLLHQDRELQPVGKRIDKNLEIISCEGDRLTRLINDVLDLSRIESGRMPWRETEFSLDELVNEAAGVLGPLTEDDPGPNIQMKLADDLPPIRADRDRFLQVVINLLDNAIKFAPTGHITVSACCRKDHLQLRIKDTGHGIPRADLVNIFDSFHQAVDDTRKVKPPGTGLGLAICRAVLARYGGCIWAESEQGQGAEFYCEMPVSPEAEEE